MSAFPSRHSHARRRAAAAAFCALPLLLALSSMGCGDVEDANPTSATCTLNPSAAFPVSQDPRPRDNAVSTTNVVNGSTNVTTTVSESTAVSLLNVSATSSGSSSWNIQASDDAGHAYSGTASGPALREPGADNAYPPGATIATFSLQCAGLSGQISAVALARIPMDVVRTSTTNGTNVVVGRQGQHSISPQNAEYRLSATVASSGDPYTLTGRAPAPAATIVW